MRSIVPPDLTQLLNDLKAEIFSTLNCVQIGQIETVNLGEQTVSVSLQIKRRISDEEIRSYPILVDCPFFVLQGGGAYIDLPVTAGDYCLVLFNDRNIDTWWSSGNVKEPPTSRKHNLSDGIALVGINPSTKVRDIDGQLVRVLGTSGAGSEEFAARQGDATQITTVTDPALFTWLSAVGTATGVGPPPSTITGKITGGSTEVKIG